MSKRSFCTRLTLLGVVPAGLLTGTASAAPAAVAGSVTPFVDCVSNDAATGLSTVYFGYSNTTGAPVSYTVGSSNEVIPGTGFEGQPTMFTTGIWPRIFSVAFDPAQRPHIIWALGDAEADATAASPACSAGAVTAATAVGPDSATLNGVVTPEHDPTTYRFEYGPTPSYGQQTAAADAGSGNAPVPVHADLTGLKASTTYYFRLDTTNSRGALQGAQGSFTTPGTAVPGLAISTGSLPAGRRGRTYSATLAATGGTHGYQWLITKGHLPAGLRLGSSSGVISGRLGAHAVAGTFTVTVIDSSKPVQEARSAAMTINVG